MANRIKGITVEISGDTTKLSKALEGVNKNIRTTQTQLKDVEKLLKLDPSNTELLSQKHKLLADAVTSTKEKLDTLKTADAQRKWHRHTSRVDVRCACDRRGCHARHDCRKKYVEKAVSGVAETMKLTMQSDLSYRLDGVSAAVLGSTGGASVVNNYYNNDNSRTVNQTNNSPKTLSRLEIYRLTRNAVKG